jgi:hypothetical protein
LKPLALDLCCGKGGWTAGLLAVGWDVIGFDVEQWNGYPLDALFWKEDIRNLSGQKILELINSDNSCYAIQHPGRKHRTISLVVASPPCQEFSYRSFPFKRCREFAANVPPDKSIWEACERIARECNAPLVLENVRGAQKYMGKAKAHYGGFYLWGDAPAILPIGKPCKGFYRDKNAKKNNPTDGFGQFSHSEFPGEYQRKDNKCFKNMVMNKNSSHSKARKEWSAKAAMIPIELSRWIGEVFKPNA